MENTCVLTVLPSIPHWKIYSLPSKKSIQYCLILKQKREFIALIENVLNQSHLNSISCSVLDKHLSKKTKTFEVIFLRDTVKNDFISLSLTVKEKHLLKRLNNLFVFLKNRGKDVQCQIQKCNIYVKCDVVVRWNIFYKLYEFLLIKFGFCNMGALFYCAIISHYTISLEKLFLRLSASTDSTSVFISMCTVKQSRYKSITNSKTPKEYEFQNNTLLRSQRNDKSSKKHSGNEIKCQKSVSNALLKRKILSNEKLVYSDAPVQKVQKLKPCSCVKINCKCHASNWKLYKNISKTSINSYSKFLLSESNILLKKQFSQPERVDFNLDLASELLTATNVNNSIIDNDKSITNYQPRFSEEKIKESSVMTKYSDQNIIQDKPLVHGSKDLNEQKNAILKSEEKISELDFKCDSETVFLPNKEKENISNLFNDFAEVDSVSKTNVFLDLFKTASGKKINVSNNALKVAEKMLAEINQTENLSSNQNNKTSASNNKNIAMTNLNESMDLALAEKMFEDISFDEFSPINSDVQSSSTFSENMTNRISMVGKVRKSLGGRRSLKPYSVPKL